MKKMLIVIFVMLLSFSLYVEKGKDIDTPEKIDSISK